MLFFMKAVVKPFYRQELLYFKDFSFSQKIKRMAFVMRLKQEITEHMKAAMRSGDTKRRDAIRLLQAAIKQREIDERIEMDDAAVVTVIEKMLKQRRDSIAQYEAAKREDLANVEKYEISVLQAYMPLAFSDSEVSAQ